MTVYEFNVLFMKVNPGVGNQLVQKWSTSDRNIRDMTRVTRVKLFHISLCFFLHCIFCDKATTSKPGTTLDILSLKGGSDLAVPAHWIFYRFTMNDSPQRLVFMLSMNGFIWIWVLENRFTFYDVYG